MHVGPLPVEAAAVGASAAAAAAAATAVVAAGGSTAVVALGDVWSEIRLESSFWFCFMAARVTLYGRPNRTVPGHMKALYIPCGNPHSRAWVKQWMFVYELTLSIP